MKDLEEKKELHCEAWGTVERGASTLSTVDNFVSLKEKGLLDPKEVPLFSIKGSSWEDVMTKYYEIQGWGTYDPE